VAAAARDLGLTHVVITSVTRDDLPDYGAQAFAATIQAVRAQLPAASIEVLTPDFMASREHLATVLAARPAVFNHNVEMVERLQPALRPGASLERSLRVLSLAKEISPETPVKSGFMVGFGETDDEIRSLMEKLHAAGCDILTIGQYMQPDRDQVKAVCHHAPEKFAEWAALAKNIGIRYVVAGPLVRSSYQAKSALEGIK
jgi:lipoic acid synthetase